MREGEEEKEGEGGRGERIGEKRGGWVRMEEMRMEERKTERDNN